MKPYTEIDCCRICGNIHLQSVLDLGTMSMSGIFPKRGEIVPEGPLELIRCVGGCGLVQLRQTYNLQSMYGDNYGYRSGLNGSMVAHLKAKAHKLELRAALGVGDIVVDIGSNDGTLLNQYLSKGLVKVGIDPTAKKFRKYYDDSVEVIADFFSAEEYRRRFRKKAKLITSISMFYDLSAPMDFMAEVASVLADDGIWHFEQSYLPTMLAKTAYDTICHEHLEYYALRQIKYMADRCGLKLIDAELNDVNGGSIAITATKDKTRCPSEFLFHLMEREADMGLWEGKEYGAFKQRVVERAMELSTLIDVIQGSGKTVLGYGASTKGNTLLAYTGLDNTRLAAIVEVNQDKFGCFTPGTSIPIIPEGGEYERDPDYFLVLPWHFREGIIEKEKAFLAGGGKLIFPLPEVEIVGGEE